jgi:hypothetical protein
MNESFISKKTPEGLPFVGAPMFPPRWFMPYDVIIQLVMTLVSMGIAIYALRGFRWVKESSLYHLYLAFAILAIGFFANGLTLGIDFITRTPGPHPPSPMLFMDLGFMIYYVASIVAYGILVYAYFKNVRNASMATAVFGVFLTATAPFMESIIIVLLFGIVFAQLIHLSIHASRSSILVCSSFALILVSHILILISDAGSEDLYVIGKLLQLVAFCALLLILLKVRRPE